MEYNLENKSHLDTLRQALRTLRLSLLRPLLVQGAECFFESLDLLLALCNALFVDMAVSTHAGCNSMISWTALSKRLCSSVKLVLSSSMEASTSVSSPSLALFETFF